MKVGILGRVGAGRNTVFDALTAGQGAARSPGKARLGIARVVDPRLDVLTGLCKPKKTVHAEVTLAVPNNSGSGPVEIAPVREMRDLAAYVCVLGLYGSEDVAEEAARQIEAFGAELVLADMERAENRRARIAKGGGARPGEEDALARAAVELEAERPLRLLEWDENARGLLDELGMMSQRPLLTVCNVAEGQAGAELPAVVLEAARRGGGELLWLCAALETEIASLEPASQQEFLSAYGLSEPVSGRFVRACLQLLDQICFFTVGPDECRAWNIRRGTGAKRAARTIHSDLEKGFIRAEVIDYDVFVAHGSEAKVKAAGKLRLEGKDYLVKDGDILNVLHSG